MGYNGPTPKIARPPAPPPPPAGFAVERYRLGDRKATTKPKDGGPRSGFWGGLILGLFLGS